MITKNLDGKVCIVKELKVTKELTVDGLDTVKAVISKYSEQFIKCLTQYIEWAEAEVVASKEINQITDEYILFTSHNGIIKMYDFRMIETARELITTLQEGSNYNLPRHQLSILILAVGSSSFVDFDCGVTTILERLMQLQDISPEQVTKLFKFFLIY